MHGEGAIGQVWHIEVKPFALTFISHNKGDLEMHYLLNDLALQTRKPCYLFFVFLRSCQGSGMKL